MDEFEVTLRCKRQRNQLLLTIPADFKGLFEEKSWYFAKIRQLKSKHKEVRSI